MKPTAQKPTKKLSRTTVAMTYVKVILENEYNLVVISVDSGIEVINSLKNADITSSQTIELINHPIAPEKVDRFLEGTLPYCVLSLT